jgi:hypothetical protein
MARPLTNRAVRFVAEALFYRDRPVPEARLAFLQAETLELLQTAGPRARTLFVLCLLGVFLLAPLFVRRLPTLGRLPLPLRIEALRRMEDSALGAPLVLAVKAALCVLYYEQPEAAREIGGGTPCLLPKAPLREERP